jgi:hypothetical protein
MPELTLDHPKRMLHLGADTGFDLFNPISQGVAGFSLVQRLALSRYRGIKRSCSAASCDKAAWLDQPIDHDDLQ